MITRIISWFIIEFATLVGMITAWKLSNYSLRSLWDLLKARKMLRYTAAYGYGAIDMDQMIEGVFRS